MLELTFFSTWTEFAVACGILLVAHAVLVLFGFGSGLVAIGTLALLMPDVRDVVVLMLFAAIPVQIWAVVILRDHIRWRKVVLICVGIAVGVPVGAWILKLSDPTFTLVILGVLLVLVGGAFLALPARRLVTWPAWADPPVGAVAGVLSGMFGLAGPPLIVYYHLGGVDKATFRANLLAIFLVVTAVRLPTYAVSGLITTERLWSSLFVLPAVIIGGYVGNKIHLEVSEIAFRRLVSISLVVIGAVLTLSAAL